MQYGDIAEIPGIGRERFAVFAFSDYLRGSGDTRLNVMHERDLTVATRRAGSLVLTDTPAGLEFDVPELPATSYARDFMALLTAGTIAPGLVAFYRIPPADVVPDAVTIETEPDTGVEIAVINSAILTALSIRYRAPRGNPGTVERRGIVTPAPAPARRRVWL